MATVLQHNAKWSVDWLDNQGKRHRRVVGDGTDRKLAKEEAQFIEAELERQRRNQRCPNTADCDFVIDEFFKSIAATISDSTGARYAVYAGHFKEYFASVGIVKFYALQPVHIEGYRNHRLETVAPKTVLGEMTVLKTLCGWAHDHGFHGQDAGHKVAKLGNRRLPERVPLHYSEIQQREILSAAWSDPQLYLMICLGLFAGCRTGGVLGLKVDDVDLVRGKLVVREKGSKERTLFIHPQLREAFERCPAKNPVHWFGEWTPRQANQLGSELTSFLRRVTGLTGDRARFHNLRHTFAITLLRQGVSIPVVSKLLGHASIMTTMIYLRVEDSDREKAIQSLPTIAFQIPSRTPPVAVV